MNIFPFVLGLQIVNVGDIFYQLFAILFWVVIIGLIVILFRNSKKKNEQLKRIEEKIDRLLEQIKKSNANGS
jgi:sensor histidine kinase YesM